MEADILIEDAVHDDLEAVLAFLKPFMEQKQLVPRVSLELELLLKHAFIAREQGTIIGFAALEIYSKKLAEIQCLAVADQSRRRGIAQQLIGRCVQRASDEKVLELMAISDSDALFQKCGFDYSLPSQKRALFLQTRND